MPSIERDGEKESFVRWQDYTRIIISLLKIMHKYSTMLDETSWTKCMKYKVSSLIRNLDWILRKNEKIFD